MYSDSSLYAYFIIYSTLRYRMTVSSKLRYRFRSFPIRPSHKCLFVFVKGDNHYNVYAFNIRCLCISLVYTI